MTLHMCILLLFTVLSFCSCKNSNSKETIASKDSNFTEHYQIKSHLDPSKQELSITINLDPGFHTYASREKIGQALRLEISPTGGWLAQEPAQIPAGQLKNLAGLGLSDVLTGQIKITQKLILGQQAGRALLYMQICTDRLCDRPRIHELALP